MLQWVGCRNGNWTSRRASWGCGARVGQDRAALPEAVVRRIGAKIPSLAHAPPPLVDDPDAAHRHLLFRLDLFVPHVEY
jgi:hypothetical protein